MYKIEKFRSEKNKQYYFRIKAGNGKIVCSSEGYKNKKDRNEIADNITMNLLNGLISKVSLNDNDLLFIILKRIISKEALDIIVEAIPKEFKKKIFICHEVELNKFSEKEMNTVGWFKEK